MLALSVTPSGLRSAKVTQVGGLADGEYIGFGFNPENGRVLIGLTNRNGELEIRDIPMDALQDAYEFMRDGTQEIIERHRKREGSRYGACTRDGKVL